MIPYQYIWLIMLLPLASFVINGLLIGPFINPKSKVFAYITIVAIGLFVTSALLGQNSLEPEMAEKAAAALGLGPDIASALTECPMKGCLDSAVVADPLIYRFHEITQVYGTTMKAIIHEMFGDGIMSAIDFKIDIQKEEDPKGDRVVVIYNGKFLPYKKW